MELGHMELDRVELRRIRPGEGGAYREVRLRALQLSPDAYEATYDESMEIPDAEWDSIADQAAEAMELAIFVIDRGEGVLAGTVFVRVNETPPFDAFVGAMWVDPDLRGSDAAASLLATAEAFAWFRGSESCELWVEEDNLSARHLYASQGFVETGVDFPGRRGGRTLLLQKDVRWQQ